MSIPLPRWLTNVPEEQREQAKTRFLLRVASLYATEEGSMTALSRIVAKHDNTIGTYAAGRERVTVKLARGIERIVGKHVIPRDLLLPGVYGSE